MQQVQYNGVPMHVFEKIIMFTIKMCCSMAGRIPLRGEATMISDRCDKIYWIASSCQSGAPFIGPAKKISG